MQPYYQADGITLFHGNCRDVLPTLADASVDLVLTDPPYAEQTHLGARTGDGDRVLVDFAPMTKEELRSCFNNIARLTTGWVVSFMDWRHIAVMEHRPPDGLAFVRFGIWVKPNGAPQFTGDRPSTGWEGIAFLARLGKQLSWNGGGRSSVFVCNKVNSAHPTGKPEPLIAQLLTLFSKPGDVVLDPFMGGGTTARVCKNLGRRFIGCDIEERWCEATVRRLSQSVMPLPEPDALPRQLPLVTP